MSLHQWLEYFYIVLKVYLKVVIKGEIVDSSKSAIILMYFIKF